MRPCEEIVYVAHHVIDVPVFSLAEFDGTFQTVLAQPAFAAVLEVLDNSFHEVSWFRLPQRYG